MPSPAEKPEDTSLIASIVDVLDTGQRVLADRIELLTVEARLLVSSSVTSLAFVLAGVGLLLVGWIAANVFVVLTLARSWSHEPAVALVAVVNVVAGGLALGLGAARRRAASGTGRGEPREPLRDAAARGPG